MLNSVLFLFLEAYVGARARQPHKVYIIV